MSGKVPPEGGKESVVKADTSSERDAKSAEYNARREEQLGDEKGTSGGGTTKR